MSVKTLTIEFVFDEELIDGEIYLSLAGLSLGDTNLTQSEREDVAETFGQSDHYFTDVVQDIVYLIDNGKPVDYS